ncbi:MAG: hypothetical protein K2Z81_25240, partial [Cyanobacteria bacterium]|nr:hypothetical protein [Cyanobacteriota bacterium]
MLRSKNKQLEEEVRNTQIANAQSIRSVEIAKEHPERQAEILNAVNLGWSQHGDRSKDGSLKWCSEQLYKAISPTALAKQAREGDDNALLALAYISPGNKDAAGLLLQLGKEQRERVLNAIVKAAGLCRDTDSTLPLMAAVLSGKTDVPAKMSREEALNVVAEQAKAGDQSSLQFLMLTKSDAYLKTINSPDAQKEKKDEQVDRLLMELSDHPSHRAAFRKAFLEMAKTRQMSEIPADLLGLALSGTTRIQPDKNGSYSEVFKELEERARAGDKDSLRLIGMALAHDKFADEAKQAVERLCDTKENTRRVLSGLLDVYHANGDSGFLLGTVGEVASKLPAVPKEVRDTLTDAFGLLARNSQSKLTKQDNVGKIFQQSSSSVVAGFMAINPAESWDAKTIEFIVENASEGLAWWLQQKGNAIPAEKAKELTRAVIQRITEGGSKNESGKPYSLAGVLDTLTPYMTPEDVKRLVKSYGYETGNGRLAIGQTLLHLYDKGSPEMKEQVIDALTTNGWSEVLQDAVRERVADYIKNNHHLSLDRLDKLFSSVRNLDLPVPVALQLKRLGVHPEYSDEQLTRLADDMVARHGIKAVNQFIASAFSYNCAPPSVQALLKSEGSLSLDQDGHIKAETAGDGGPLDMTKLVDALAYGDPSTEFKFVERIPERMAEVKQFSKEQQKRLEKEYEDVMKSRARRIETIGFVNGGRDGIPDFQAKVTAELRALDQKAQQLAANMMIL